ncbi:MAG: hypothetical protein Q4D95_02145 [Peptoniphilus sp.]|nr:hypothetical protein [Peptoniphilus sp.]
MKKYIAAFVSLVLVALNFQLILSLKKDMARMNVNIINLKNSVEFYQSTLQSKLAQAIEDGNSIIESFDYDLKNFDKEKKTFEFQYNIAPKEYSINSKAYLSIDGIQEEMTLQGSNFVLNKNIPMDKDFVIENFSLVDGEKTIVQKLNSKISPLGESTFKVVGIPLGFSYEKEKGQHEFTVEKTKMDFSIHYGDSIDSEDQTYNLYKPKTASIVVYIDDEVAKTMDYDIVYKFEDEANVDKMLGFDCYIDIDELKFEAPAPSKVEVNFEIEDEFGLTHVMNLISKEISEDGSLQEGENYIDNYIKDDGKIIYFYDSYY